MPPSYSLGICRIILLLLLCVIGAGAPVAARSPEADVKSGAAKAEPAAHGKRIPIPPLCPKQAPCGDHCGNLPYVENDCWTTLHGPASANVVISASGNPQESSNMLLCDAGPYALCFYSGPPDATGKGGNQALPCTVDESGKTANCSCQYYSNSVSYVDINGILNQNAYYETVQQCGHGGAGCANMLACGSAPGVSTASCKMQEAKVCAYVRNQSAQQPAKSLHPGYDTISTFSLKMAPGYDMSGVTSCKGTYLGCMTAPCRFPTGVSAPQDGSIVQCECPVVHGIYQIGQVGSDVACEIPPSSGVQYLWSAARTVTHGDPAQNHP
ncbi:MAG: hypothetical protein ABI411_12535 [Tahibacter sp.]